jgi:hypothetical protein
MLTFSLTFGFFFSFSKCDMVCGIRVPRHHGSRRTCTVGVPHITIPGSRKAPGEDWTDAKLTLTTADMDLSKKTILVSILYEDPTS